MLNYIWISLIALGIVVAAGSDIADEAGNTYRNGIPLDARFEVTRRPSPLRATWEGRVVLSAAAFNAFYGPAAADSAVAESAVISTDASGGMRLVMTPGEAAPARWKAMALHAAEKGRLSASVLAMNVPEEGAEASVRLVMEPVRFVKLKAVTSAALDYAATAVNISIGLIGVMALWLGVMKVAEEAGLLKVITRLLAPLTRRLFPDVPEGHPALASMVMNIAANMLGLNNAATPMGLKAMEELNRLNPKVGTATNAMVTFLAINTGGLVLIPATAIAVRAAAGSANPGIIIGTSIIGSGCATIAGIAASRLLQRLPRYRRPAEVDNG
ncbi:MAG TPA: nucleoside recognition domain-containing protein [Bacteroidota bacterium]|nr:nucleoside recognition domain-containing protein [Bacteroidota bacterium]